MAITEMESKTAFIMFFARVGRAATEDGADLKVFARTVNAKWACQVWRNGLSRLP